VLFHTAAQLKDAKPNQKSVMIETHVPKIVAKQENVSLIQSLVMIKTHVLMIVVIQLLDVDLFQNKLEIQTCAPLELVMQ
jgi:hypothetical protein